MGINIFAVPEVMTFVLAICIIWFLGMVLSCAKEFFKIVIKKMETKEKESYKDEKRT